MTLARRHLLEAEYSYLWRVAHALSNAWPAHLRDDLRSELLVAMTVAARDWDGSGTFRGYVRVRMKLAAIDWARRELYYRSGGTREAPVPLNETFAAPLVDAPSRLDTVAALRLVADLPPRELAALRGGRADRELGVSEGRVSQLRARACDRLVAAGLRELMAA